jgi:uncharacterized membrane protein YccC
MPTNMSMLERRSQGLLAQEPVLREAVREQEREEALERLLALLEQGASEVRVHCSLAKSGDMSRLARLRNARATYFLLSNGRVRRVGPGAYLMRRQ